MNVVVDKSSTGLDANVAAALTYLPIIAIVFLVIEKGSRFVKFHAVQSLLLCVAWFVLYFAMTVVGLVLGQIPVLGFIASILMMFVWLAIGLGGLVLWIIAILKAFQGEKWKMPYIGDIAEQQSANL
jgi:uncharacterized membrane protein